MENASKALMVTAGVLMGVMILSLMVYIITIFADFASGIEDDRERQQAEAFNAQFYRYQQLATISAHDIVSVINLARESNEKNGYTESSDSSRVARNEDSYIQVIIDSSGLILSGANSNHCEWWTEEQKQLFIQNNMIKDPLTSADEDSVLRFECTEVRIGEDTNYVNRISFKKAPLLKKKKAKILQKI